MPLRAGPFRAALVYGQPNTWDGFRYIVFAEQFQGSLLDPFGDLPRKFGDLVGLTVAQFGFLAPAIPVAFVVTVIRHPRYALLTGTAAGITCFFAASYVNADISRYYLGPALMAWTWLAILAGVIVDAISGLIGEGPAAPTIRTRTIAAIVALALLLPTLAAVPDRSIAVDMRHRHDADAWVDHALAVMEPDSVVVSWWSYSTPLWYRQRVLGQRPDLAIVDDRTRLDEGLGSLTDVIDANLGKRPVYVIRVDPREVALLAERYQLEYIDGQDATQLTRVISRRAGT